GHAHPRVVEAVQSATARGTSYGAPTEAEVALAEKVCDWVAPVEQVRFVSSGTEATMSAIRLARGYTGRDLIIKFAGCYHGHADYLLVQAGSGLATFGTPSSAGVPKAFADQTLIATYNDIASVESLFQAHSDKIACVIIEPVAANNGLIIPDPDFIPAVIKCAHKHGALFISDEVITGFRLGRGGAAERLKFTPDLMTFGKVIGGGLPVGAFGGPRKIMEKIAPLGPVYQAGTLSGNPLAMQAGLASLAVIEEEGVYNRIEMSASLFESELRERVDFAGMGFGFVRIGSIFWFNLGGTNPPSHPGEIPKSVAEKYTKLFHYALSRGVYIAPSAYEVGFISAAHDDGSLKTAAAVLAEG
ncbi:MAG TPA: glutamate-1-semialdehyde 2,1-aminomutase, partial [candidate division Zixibacteria bacterium]|nr:glutamate-1-semialdehyde 2,1-aminomutase [candidate division Zixibacteria bacterium]